MATELTRGSSTTVDVSGLPEPVVRDIRQLVETLRAKSANGHSAPSAGETLARLNDWMAVVETRAGRYPAGHETDVGRESMYEGCGE